MIKVKILKLFSKLNKFKNNKIIADHIKLKMIV